MQRMPSRGSSGRPTAIQTRSFTRHDSGSSLVPAARSRVDSEPLSGVASPTTTNTIIEDGTSERKDVFDSRNEEEEEDTTPNDGTASPELEGAHDLPIEIRSLMDRFLESLGPASQGAPLAIDRLSELYQGFYIHAETHIATHIAALSTKLSREKSPTPSHSSGASRSSKRRPRAGLENRTGEHQMLTASEVEDKRKARRLLEVQRLALEEAVESGVCERIYPRLWRHRSTDDDERDEKIRSRAAALRLVGLDLQELLSSAMGDPSEDAQKNKPDSPPLNLAADQLEAARFSLQSMNGPRSPAGKLKALKLTHKNIVEALSQMFPSTSSADEILPTLIYLIISSPPGSLHLVSNMAFIQRFRAAARMDGEAAYCLTNLEAAIGFLETVDLSSLRPEAGAKNDSHPSTPRIEAADPLYQGLSSSSPTDEKGKQDPGDGDGTKYRPRTLSTILKPGAPRQLEAAIESADLAYDKIHSALDGSFRYFFGRMKEKQAAVSPSGASEVAAPKTLEDARKLVSDSEQPDDTASLGEISLAPSENQSEDGSQPKPDVRGKTMELIGGKKHQPRPRQRSIDSVRSASSTTKQAAPAADKISAAQVSSPPTPAETTAAGGAVSALNYTTAAESMRNLGYYGLSKFGGWGSMRGFGKPGTPPAPQPPPPSNSASGTAAAAAAAAASDGSEKAQPETSTPAAGTTSQESASTRPAAAAFDLSGVGPPIQRFVDLREARELNGFDVELLLRDYQRLAGAFGALRQEQEGRGQT